MSRCCSKGVGRRAGLDDLSILILLPWGRKRSWARPKQSFLPKDRRFTPWTPGEYLGSRCNLDPGGMRLWGRGSSSHVTSRVSHSRSPRPWLGRGCHETPGYRLSPRNAFGTVWGVPKSIKLFKLFLSCFVLNAFAEKPFARKMICYYLDC